MISRSTDTAMNPGKIHTQCKEDTTFAWAITALVLTFSMISSAIGEGIENVPNSRITISRITPLLNINSKDVFRTLPKAIESLEWSPDGKSLLVDTQGVNQFFSIAIMSTSGEKTSIRQLSNSRDTGNTRLNNSNPCFHKDGKHYVFIGQDLNSREYARSLPGIGLFSNICLAKINSPNYWNLTNYVSSYKLAKGAVMPRFSKDGQMLCWTTCIADAEDRNFWGRRSIAIAKFAFANDTPELTGIRNYSPSSNRHPFYETYGFSPDGKSLLFASNLAVNQQWFTMDICSLNLENGQVTKLTDTPNDWNRFAAYSPNGKKIIYTSSEGFSVPFLGNDAQKWKNELFSELWIMNSNGTEKRKLSGFNDPGNPFFAKTKAFVGMVTWHPIDPNKIAFILNVRNNAYTNFASIVIAELSNSTTGNPIRK